MKALKLICLLIFILAMVTFSYAMLARDEKPTTRLETHVGYPF
jgi:hypothetical protein